MERVKRLLVIGPESRYADSIFRGIYLYCSSHGQWEYRMEAEGNPHAATRWRAAIGSWKADGIIGHVKTTDWERTIKRTGLPAVNVSGVIRSELPTARSNSWAVGQMAAEHFLERGFRHFAYCALTPEVYSQERCEGFVELVQERGFSCSVFKDEYRSHLDDQWVENQRRMARWLGSLAKPVGLFCLYDIRAHEVSWMCQHLRLRVPEDVAIVGADNHEVQCLACNPPLSSVEQDLERVGYCAARLLDRMMRGAKPPRKPILIEPRGIVVRQSSDVVATDDQDVAASIRFIRERAGEPICVKDILQAVPVSRKTMERRFERVIGRTPAAELARVRMEMAKRFLEETDLLIPQVARRCGFTDPKVFTASFHRRVGTTPTMWRKRSRLTATGLDESANQRGSGGGGKEKTSLERGV